MPLPRIAVDHDEIIADLWYPLIPYLNEVFNVNHDKDDINDFWLENTYKCSRQEMTEHIERFIHSDAYLETGLLPGAAESLKVLNEIAELVLITNRWESLRERTLSVLYDRIPPVFDEEHFLGVQFTSGHKKKTKGEVAAEIGASIAIDDSAENAISFVEHGIDVILFDNWWNDQDLPREVHRVSGWEEAVPILQELIS